ncbi:MAG: phosphohydrolase [Acidobacteria bacterium]|nr:MAG: phosphohydrolase [Acidobacteriota bacterium]
MDESDLRKLYPPTVERARLKTQFKLDKHSRNFIARSPFVCIGSSSERGADVTPRGDEPGFVLVLDDTTLAIPDWPGNNRLDSFSNIVLNPQVALLFLIPGVDETLRASGTAEIRTSSELLERWQRNGKKPRAVLVVTIREAFFHCGKALIRSRLWKDDYKIQRSELPPYGEILKDQIVTSETAEQIEMSIQSGYKNKLY